MTEHQADNPPIISIVGASGAGKTTLMERLIPELKRRGIRVGTVKHDVHNFQMDRPGKDSWRHKQAGAAVSIISSPHQVGMIKDADHDHRVEELRPLLGGVDVILTEGYKRQPNPKLEVFRSTVLEEPLCRGDKTLLAMITDDPVDPGVPRFSFKDIRGLAKFLITSLSLTAADSPDHL